MHDVKERILKAAVELVAEQGVRAISFREVARRASVSHQAPYHIFENAQGILREIAREGFLGLTKHMRKAADDAGKDALSALQASGIAYVDFARGHVGHFRVMFQQSLVDIHSEQNPLPEAKATHDTLIEFVLRAQKAGHGKGIPAEVMTLLCWSSVHGLATLLVENTLGKGGAVSSKEQAKAARMVVGALSQLMKR